MIEKEFKIAYTFIYNLLAKICGVGILLGGLNIIRITFGQENQTHVQILMILFGMIVCVFGFICIAESFSSTTINAQGIRQKNLAKEIYIASENVGGYAELDIKGQGINEDQLLIFSKDKKKKIRFYKQFHNQNDYNQLINQLKHRYGNPDFEYIKKFDKKQNRSLNIEGQIFGVAIAVLGMMQLTKSLNWLLLILAGIAIFIYYRKKNH